MGYDYGYDYGYGSADASSAVAGIFGGMMIFVVVIALIALIVGIIQLIGTWKVFKKAGKGGWESIIPFYCNWVLVEISGLNWWWFLFFFAPTVFSFIGLSWLGYIVYLFAVFNCYYNLAKKFNKGLGFAVCLTLFTPICLPILGFSKDSVYNNSVVVSNNGVIPASGNNNNQSQQPVNNQMYNTQPVQQPVNNQMYNAQPVQQPVNNQMYNAQPVQPMVQPTIEPVVPVEPIMPQPQNNQPTTCSKCGSPINPGDKFCMSCGNQL